MNRELLEKPFNPDQIKQREGNFGKTLEYIEGHAVIARLNDAFDSSWSFEIIKHKILTDTDEVIVLGKLIAGDIVKTQFGSSRITRARESGDMISLADDLKAAATDALKKAATLLGVGLHLYAGAKQSNPNPPRTHNSRTQSARDGNGGNGVNGSGNQQENNGNGRISAKQHKFILDLITSKGMTKSQLNQHCTQIYGSVVDYINRSDASGLIDWLRSQ
ncbi:MAG TPA: hypothetical protein HPQ03_17180 [Deltaproteobacteria bacterium]|nr:hypothetical protein [Deltaproteobacteria bacterium]